MTERARMKDGEFVLKGEAVKAAASKAKRPDVKAVTLSPYLMRRHRERLAGWLRDNGIDPDTVSTSHPIQVKGSVITYQAFDLGVCGQPQEEAATDKPVIIERTARCDAAPPSLTRGDSSSERHSE